MNGFYTFLEVLLYPTLNVTLQKKTEEIGGGQPDFSSAVDLS